MSEGETLLAIARRWHRGQRRRRSPDEAQRRFIRFVERIQSPAYAVDDVRSTGERRVAVWTGSGWRPATITREGHRRLDL